ncbi:MAG: hypothetical protein H7332_19330 [Bdellovibrionales bacterium]|nr:hypothetical protein [Ramlibacter sp.]
MNELLNNPAVQAGVVPFLVALALAWPLSFTRFTALAAGVAFAATVALVIGFSFPPSTSMQKLVLVVLLGVALIIPFELSASRLGSARLRLLLAGAAGVGVLWVMSRLLLQQETLPALLAGGAAALYAALLVYAGSNAAPDPVPSAAAAWVLALGSGVLALLSASALLAQLGICMAAAAGAVLLVLVFRGLGVQASRTLALPAHLAAALIGPLAVATGSLPWYGLVPLLALPWAAGRFPMTGRAVWLRGLICSSMAFVPMLLAVLLSLYSAMRAPGA